jgi:two-component system phosphate regulon sensor histidine kinase PhoR
MHKDDLPETLQLFMFTLPSILRDARKYAVIITGFNELLNRELAGSLNEQQKELIQESMKRAKMLFHILNQSIILSSLDVNPRTPEPVNYPLKEIIQEATQIALHRRKPKSHAIRIEELSNNVEVFVDKDDAIDGFVQVIENAIIYTPNNGEISITIREQEGNIAIAIQDNGVGIPIEHQKRLFQRLSSHYQQLPNELSSSGVGLAIAKAVLQRNNGSIQLTHSDEKGSIFTILLPKYTKVM